MGKGAHILITVVEGILSTLFAILRSVVLLILKTNKQEKVKQIPPARNPLLLLSATELASKIRRKEVSSVEIVNVFANRLKEIHPYLNVIVNERFKAALRDAHYIDEFLSETDKTEEELEDNVPLLGVPFTVKESLCVNGLSHTSGLRSRRHVYATEDADAVALLRKAGGIPIANTNTPEVCCWWETYNPLHGRTSNPYNSNHTSGGSSGGEGAAIAAAGSVLGLGSDFGGSIRIPAAFNGIFGHKPTSLTVSIEGHFPVPPQDTVKAHLVTGPMARHVKDLRLATKIITSELAPNLNLNASVDLKKIKIYYMEDEEPHFLITPVQQAVKDGVRKTVRYLKSIGVNVEKVNLSRMKYCMIYWYAVIKEKETQLGNVVTNNEGDVNFLKELFKLTIGRSEHTLPVILFGLLEAGNGIPYRGTIHTAVLDDFERLNNDFKNLLKTDAVFIYPTHPTTALPHKEALARSFDAGYSAIFNVLGYPSTQCPVGRDEKGLPVGVQVVANKHQDRLTLAVAEEIEKGLGGWTPPYRQQQED